MQEAKDRIVMLKNEHKLSVTPYQYSNAWSIKEGYNEEKIDSVFPCYFDNIQFDYTGLFLLETPRGYIVWAIVHLLVALAYYGGIYWGLIPV